MIKGDWITREETRNEAKVCEVIDHYVFMSIASIVTSGKRKFMEKVKK